MAFDCCVGRVGDDDDGVCITRYMFPWYIQCSALFTFRASIQEVKS